MLRMSFRSARLTRAPRKERTPGWPESGTRALRRIRTGRGQCPSAAQWKGRHSRAKAIRGALRARAAARCLLTKNALLDDVWGHQFVTESVLKTAISEVRAALGDDPKEPRYIETVSRRGYRFIASTIGASSQRAPAIERNVAAGRDHPGLAALTALCRGDAALAELIRAVAATLEREPLVLNES